MLLFLRGIIGAGSFGCDVVVVVVVAIIGAIVADGSPAVAVVFFVLLEGCGVRFGCRIGMV